MATIVRKRPGESEDKLIANFRKIIAQEKLLIEVKERQYYKPPSVKRKERLAELRRGKKR
jgi:ribosomal protein S21